MHNISRTADGRRTVAVVGQAAWHNLGQRVDSAMTSAEAIGLAGLDWTVSKRPLYIENPAPAPFTRMPEKFATVRDDTGAGLGVVGTQYRVLQNKESFSFFDAIVGEKAAMYHTAGALGLGERVWLLAKLPQDVIVKGRDVVNQFLLLHNSHDGSRSVEVMFTPIRVVCQNTLNAALGGEGQARVRHTSGLGTNVQRVRDYLGIAVDYFKRFGEAAELLAAKQATPAIVNNLLDELGLKVKDEKNATRTRNIRLKIQELYLAGKGNSENGIRGTMWALWNGVTEYADHYRSTRGNETERLTNRAHSLLFGSSADMKQRALDSLLAMAR